MNMNQTINISTKRKEEIIDITSEVEGVVKRTGVKEGLCTVFARHATAAIIINENWDVSLQDDLLNLLRKLVPSGVWKHDKIDDNGAAHLKSMLLGPSETIPVKNGKLMLGRWQGIALAEFDGPRKREVIVQVMPK